MVKAYLKKWICSIFFWTKEVLKLGRKVEKISHNCHCFLGWVASLTYHLSHYFYLFGGGLAVRIPSTIQASSLSLNIERLIQLTWGVPLLIPIFKPGPPRWDVPTIPPCYDLLTKWRKVVIQSQKWAALIYLTRRNINYSVSDASVRKMLKPVR